MKEKRKRSPKDIIGNILFVSLVLSIVFCLIRFLNAPTELGEGSHYEKVKSDYLLMLLQCCMGVVVMLLPSLIAHKWKLGIPNFIYILYYVFLYCAVFLGEVFEFYYLVPHWDTILHTFSGAMLAALGFILVDMLTRDEHVRVSLSPLFVALFSFCFALAAGAVWEIYEYTMDGLMSLNMQKYLTAEGVARVGREALGDTMKDIIFDALAALAVSVAGYFSIIKKKNEQGEVKE